MNLLRHQRPAPVPRRRASSPLVRGLAALVRRLAALARIVGVLAVLCASRSAEAAPRGSFRPHDRAAIVNKEKRPNSLRAFRIVGCSFSGALGESGVSPFARVGLAGRDLAVEAHYEIIRKVP